MSLWPADKGDADFKLRRYHFPLRNYKSTVPWKRNLCQFLWKTNIWIQKKLCIERLQEDIFVKTDNWLSLTQQACAYLVCNRKRIIKKYRWSFCGDEYFVVSELKASGQDFHICDCPKLLLVQFENDSPRSFPRSAYPDFLGSGYLWARKFKS